VLVVSAKQVALYGHLARVGEIMGIAELCLPNTNIVEMEEFNTVSVTAEKWLNITEHRFQHTDTHKHYGQPKNTTKPPKNPHNKNTHKSK
jgi:hypothetical protein